VPRTANEPFGQLMVGATCRLVTVERLHDFRSTPARRRAHAGSRRRVVEIELQAKYVVKSQICAADGKRKPLPDFPISICLIDVEDDVR